MSHLVKFSPAVQNAYGQLVRTSSNGLTITKTMMNEGGRNGHFGKAQYKLEGAGVSIKCDTLADAKMQANWTVDPNWEE